LHHVMSPDTSPVHQQLKHLCGTAGWILGEPFRVFLITQASSEGRVSQPTRQGWPAKRSAALGLLAVSNYEAPLRAALRGPNRVPIPRPAVPCPARPASGSLTRRSLRIQPRGPMRGPALGREDREGRSGCLDRPLLTDADDDCLPDGSDTVPGSPPMAAAEPDRA